MNPTPSNGGSGDDARRIPLEPDALHEGDQQPYIDCPNCGSPAPLSLIVLEGSCSNTLDADTAEVESEDTELQSEGCPADLSLELVWKA